MNDSANNKVSAIVAIIHKEWREVVRDGRFRFASVATVLLLLLAMTFGWQQAERIHHEREAAGDVARKHWDHQGEKNPHMATHYGMYVFKPTGSLSYLDPGVEPYLGVSVKIEGHRQNLPTHAAASDSTAIHQFGGLTVATGLQWLVPLLIIGLAFGSWTSERERGTLRQLASSGLALPVLAVGKTGGLLAVLAALLIPTAALGGGVVSALGHFGVVDVGRIVAFMAAYGVYFLVFVAVTLAISATASASRVALVLALGFWVTTAVVAPRVLADVVGAIKPLPTAYELAHAVAESLDKGLPGQTPKEERVEEFSKELLEQHGFLGAEMMMPEALLQGLELQAEARFENEVFDYHFGALNADIGAQEVWAQWLSFFSPTLAVRSLSMAFAGTDHAHHRDFFAHAEQYRRELVQLMDNDFATNAGADGWDYVAGPELWAKAPRFEYEPPGLFWVLGHQWKSVLALMCWLVGAGVTSWVFARRMRVI